MWQLYDPLHSVLGCVLQQEIHNHQLVNEHALLPINNYLQTCIIPHFWEHPIQTYLDIAAGTGVLSARIVDILRKDGHNPSLFTLDLVNNTANLSEHVQANAMQLPFQQHSFDFITVNFGFRYFTTQPQQDVVNADIAELEKTASKYGLDNDYILYNQFISKGLFLYDILARVLKPSGRLMLTISTENLDTQLCVWRSALSTLVDCFHAEEYPWSAIHRFWRIANPTSIAFLEALYQEDVAKAHKMNHFFNIPTVTQALLEHFQGQVISDNSHTYLSILEFRALNLPQRSQVVQTEIEQQHIEYAV